MESGVKTILVVDDDMDIRDLLGDILDDAGYRVVFATDGREALTVMQQARPDLILLDLIMPVMNGWDAMRELRALAGDPPAPIVLVAASLELPRWAEELQAESFIAKPFHVDAVLSEVQRWLEPDRSG